MVRSTQERLDLGDERESDRESESGSDSEDGAPLDRKSPPPPRRSTTASRRFNKRRDYYERAPFTNNVTAFTDDVTVVDVGEFPPLFTGGCCRGGHDLNVYIFLVVLAVCMNLSGSMAIVITDTLGDTTADAFVAGAVLISLGLPLLFVSLHAFNIKAAHDLASIIYTFDETELDEGPSPDRPLIEKPEISARALDRKDLIYHNLMSTAAAVTTVVPILSTVCMVLVDVCVLYLRAFNERTSTLVLSIFIYLVAFALLFYLIAYKYRQERTLALALTLRPSLLSALREGHGEDPTSPLFIGGRTSSPESQFRVKELTQALQLMVQRDLQEQYPHPTDLMSQRLQRIKNTEAGQVRGQAIQLRLDEEKREKRETSWIV